MLVSFTLRFFSESHGEEEEEEEDAEDDDEDDEGDEAEEVGEENDRPYNLRQRKTVQRYEAPPIGILRSSDFQTTPYLFSPFSWFYWFVA